ncbi:MAG: DUF998 domain-containing protein [Acidimicrobiales bacterium]
MDSPTPSPPLSATTEASASATAGGAASPARRLAAGAAAAGLGASMASVTALAVARPDLRLAHDAISEYVHGPFGYVQTLVFLVVAASSAVVAALLPVAGRATAGRWMRLGLLVWAAGMALGGAIDVEDAVAGTDSGAVHNVVVKVAFVALAGSMVAACRRPGASAFPRPGSRLWSLVLLVTLVGSATLEGMPLFGTVQRILATTAVLWLVTVALDIRAAACDSPPGS